MSIIIFLIVLVALILVHEFGHFIVAKKSGIRVDEFGVGFPPKVFGKKCGETEYSVNAFPFGGFVRIFGENPNEESLSGPDRARAFINKPRLIQAAVLFAGVFFNILFAWVLFSGALMLGSPVLTEGGELYISNERLLVTEVLPHSPAERVGLSAGDVVVSLSVGSGTLTPQSAEDISAFVGSHKDESITFDIERNGEIKMIAVQPEQGVIESEPNIFAVGIGTGLVGTRTLPAHLALWEGAKLTYTQLSAIVVGIGSLLFDILRFHADFSGIAGPVGIVGLIGSASALGLVALINFTAIISLNLAVVNMIPFPALDGGRLFFLAIEAVKGSRITPRVANSFNIVGFGLLILLMLVVTYHDILRLIG